MEDFNTVVDDYSYYLGTTRESLQAQHIKIIDTEAPKVVFLQNNGLRSEIRPEEHETIWQLILFNGREIKVVDITDPEEDIRNFSK